ncbi:MAG: hypothetical protein CSA20_03060 [Deltaproteobacteria bacterium]|nr:MAG: hypothetical protein CSA20_03060 [Deltaproteobacteria bacterium]
MTYKHCWQVIALFPVLPLSANSGGLLLPEDQISVESTARGQGQLRRFGFHVYAAGLWSKPLLLNRRMLYNSPIL